ncbi:hypothetical protein TrRE_jg10561 [Triparma retinervis]|uniref:Uncharacterized protein n=1 Tax=Triparma retinervis TaxID=2557542 RepID=A0A9W7DMT5_9STRA|nr:hypothetical protein TrRE_jg10561 [Triparma retinervis]
MAAFLSNSAEWGSLTVEEVSPPYTGSWPSHPAVLLVQEALRSSGKSDRGEELVDLVLEAANSEEQYLDVLVWIVETTVHLSRVFAAFSKDKSDFFGPGEGARDMLFNVLHGYEADLSAPIAAQVVIDKLSEEMEDAWNDHSDGGRQLLLRLPSENDIEAEVVGRFPGGDGVHNGAEILRPVLRQKIPEGVYVPDNHDANKEKSGDEFGERYMEAVLIPSAERVLPVLKGICEAVRSEVEGVEVHVPPLKTATRIWEKCGIYCYKDVADHYNHEYPQQASNVDVARAMLKIDCPEMIVRALEAVRGNSECRVVRVKNRFGSTVGVRDLLVNVEIDGVYAEIQVGLKNLIDVRRKMHKFYNVVRSEGSDQLGDAAKPL